MRKILMRSRTDEKFERCLCDLLEEYAQDCYNDSVSHVVDILILGGDTLYLSPSIDPGINYGYIETKAVWYHREPTFDGFIKWLSKRTWMQNKEDKQ